MTDSFELNDFIQTLDNKLSNYKLVNIFLDETLNLKNVFFQLKENNILCQNNLAIRILENITTSLHETKVDIDKDILWHLFYKSIVNCGINIFTLNYVIKNLLDIENSSIQIVDEKKTTTNEVINTLVENILGFCVYRRDLLYSVLNIIQNYENSIKIDFIYVIDKINTAKSFDKTTIMNIDKWLADISDVLFNLIKKKMCTNVELYELQKNENKVMWNRFKFLAANEPNVLSIKINKGGKNKNSQIKLKKSYNKRKIRNKTNKHSHIRRH